MNTQNERGDRADCFVSKFSSKEYLVSTRVAYSVPEQHKLVVQSWYPRQLLAAGLSIFESTLYKSGAFSLLFRVGALTRVRGAVVLERGRHSALAMAATAEVISACIMLL